MAVGLYIHIPFCVKKCRYCDFVSYPDRLGAADAYLDALEREAAEYKGAEIDTVFIGGGTPSVLSADRLGRLFGIIRAAFKTAPDAEFTMEINPGTLDGGKIEEMLRGGVNRASVGIQSFDAAELKALGRIHSPDQAERAVRGLFAAGIKNINADIMTSIPNQTAESLARTLERTVSLPVRHISAYSLIIEEGTPLYADWLNGAFTPPDDDEDRDNYDMLTDFLEKNGFTRYEISNFAKAGFECRHNIKYWECREYIGLGAAAHSYIGGKRFYNVSGLNKYLDGGFRSGGASALSDNDKMSEFMMMGLRMTNGVSEDEFYRRFGRELKSVYGAEIEKFTGAGLMMNERGRVFLTRRGLDVSNSVMCEFML